MEGIVGLLEYLETHPGVSALLEVVTILCVLFVYRSGRRGRKTLHVRIDELEKQFTKHDSLDQYRYGRIEGALGRIEGGMNGSAKATPSLSK